MSRSQNDREIFLFSLKRPLQMCVIKGCTPLKQEVTLFRRCCKTREFSDRLEITDWMLRGAYRVSLHVCGQHTLISISKNIQYQFRVATKQMQDLEKLTNCCITPLQDPGDAHSSGPYWRLCQEVSAYSISFLLCLIYLPLLC